MGGMGFASAYVRVRVEVPDGNGGWRVVYVSGRPTPDPDYGDGHLYHSDFRDAAEEALTECIFKVREEYPTLEERVNKRRRFAAQIERGEITEERREEQIAFDAAWVRVGRAE